MSEKSLCNTGSHEEVSWLTWRCHRLRQSLFFSQYESWRHAPVLVMWSCCKVDVEHARRNHHAVDVHSSPRGSPAREGIFIAKLHNLESHVVPWIGRFWVGFVLIGELCAESIHTLSSALRRTCDSVVNTLQRKSDRQPIHIVLYFATVRRRQFQRSLHDGLQLSFRELARSLSGLVPSHHIWRWFPWVSAWLLCQPSAYLYIMYNNYLTE